MKILVLNGPNLNMLGLRNKKHYGTKTLKEINATIEKKAMERGVSCIFFQSNHEGALIDSIHKNWGQVEGILINPGALTHYGYALRDALLDVKLPIVEVHLSKVNNREEFRKIDVLDGLVIDKIQGKKERSYFIGLEKLLEKIT